MEKLEKQQMTDEWKIDEDEDQDEDQDEEEEEDEDEKESAFPGKVTQWRS